MNILGLRIGHKNRVFVERRKTERVQTNQALFVDYRSPIHLTGGSGEGKNLSAGGVRFACYSPYPIGTPLELKLRFRQGELAEKVVPARAFVVRCYRKPIQRRYRIACAFSRLEPQSLKEIGTFISWVKAQNARVPL